MGLQDRDYMKSGSTGSPKPGSDDSIEIKKVAALLGKLFVLFVAIFLSLRFPMVGVKIALVAVTLYLGWLWIFRTGRKKTKQPEQSGQSANTAECDHSSNTDSAPAIESKQPGREEIRQLIAWDASGEFGKVKSLIQSLDGEVFPDDVAEELALLARNYFPIHLEPEQNGTRFVLA